jgi:hypothetical protein
MNDEHMRLSKAVLSGGLGLISAAGTSTTRGQAIADAARAHGAGWARCSSTSGTRIINSIGVHLLEIMEKVLRATADLLQPHPGDRQTFDITLAAPRIIRPAERGGRACGMCWLISCASPRPPSAATGPQLPEGCCAPWWSPARALACSARMAGARELA